MSLLDTTKTLVARAEDDLQVCTWNLATEAPGGNQSGSQPDNVLDGVIEDLEWYLKDESPVMSVAMTADYAEILIDDFRGLSGSRTLSGMAQTEKCGMHTFRGRDREILDECYKDPEKFKQPKSGRPADWPADPEELGDPKPFVATYQVSREAPAPYTREVRPGGTEHDGLLREFVEELKRLKGNGVVVSATLNAQSAVIMVDAPNGL